MREPRSKYAILGMLTLRPMSGYDIRKSVERSVSSFWSESYGQIYPILRTLLADGLATRVTEANEGKPDRHVYAPTDKGRRELRRWLAEPTEHQVGRVELLLKLFFARQLKRDDVRNHLERFRDRHAALLKGYDAKAAELRETSAERPDYPFWLMTVSYGQHVSRALIAWSEESLRALGSNAQPSARARRRKV
jgi:DNA-binding PadR family transcriptional regulator